jgi:hypothetical protein
MENLYRLEVESIDLGADVRAVGLELIEPENREPVKGSEGAAIWAALMPALAGEQPWALDFFAHIERVREFCCGRDIWSSRWGPARHGRRGSGRRPGRTRGGRVPCRLSPISVLRRVRF